eukprot:gene26082-30127_t
MADAKPCSISDPRSQPADIAAHTVVVWKVWVSPRRRTSNTGAAREVKAWLLQRRTMGGSPRASPLGSPSGPPQGRGRGWEKIKAAVTQLAPQLLSPILRKAGLDVCAAALAEGGVTSPMDVIGQGVEGLTRLGLTRADSFRIATDCMALISNT